MNSLFAAVVSALALSAAAVPTSTKTATASAVSATSSIVAPNSVVQFQLFQTDLCIAGTNTTVGAQFTLESCDAELATFDLPAGAPTATTQLVLNGTFSSGGPISCVNARNVAANAPVFLDVCEDDALEHWRVVGGSGTGVIINTGTPAGEGTFCLTSTGFGPGAPIEFSSCTGGLTQTWTTILKSSN